MRPLRIILFCSLCVFVVPSLSWAESQPAFAPNAEDAKDRTLEIEELEKEIYKTELFMELNSYGHWVAGSSPCQHDRKSANEYARQLRELNAEYEGQATEEYQQEHLRLKDQYDSFTVSYESCFGRLLQTKVPEKIAAEGLRDYEFFDLRHAELQNYLGKHGKSYAAAESYLADLKERLKEIEEGDEYFAGTLMSVFKGVEIGRQGGWVAAKEGMKLYKSDELRTGPYGRARLELNDRVEDGNRGPTVINIGSGSHIRIEKFETSFTDNPPVRQGVLDLIRGTVRAFTKNWGASSVFSVRTGTSLCGIRGTDVVIDYQPQLGLLGYFLDHGSVQIDTPAARDPIILEGGQTLVVQEDFTLGVQEMTSEQWRAVTENTDPGGSDMPPI